MITRAFANVDVKILQMSIFVIIVKLVCVR